MNPTTERELKLDVDSDVAPKLVKMMAELVATYGWPLRSKTDQINYDRYFDQLLPSGLFLLHSQDAYVRVRKSVWTASERELEFIAYRKLSEAGYGRPAEIYDNEISVLKIKEITNELLRDHINNLRQPSLEAIGAVEHLETMGLAEIIRLKCERSVFTLSQTDQSADQVKIKVDRVTYKAHPDKPFTQVEIDYYSPELFDMASRIIGSIENAIHDLTGVKTNFSSTSKMTKGIDLL